MGTDKRPQQADQRDGGRPINLEKQVRHCLSRHKGLLAVLASGVNESSYSGPYKLGLFFPTIGKTRAAGSRVQMALN